MVAARLAAILYVAHAKAESQHAIDASTMLYLLMPPISPKDAPASMDFTDQDQNVLSVLLDVPNAQLVLPVRHVLSTPILEKQKLRTVFVNLDSMKQELPYALHALLNVRPVRQLPQSALAATLLIISF